MRIGQGYDVHKLVEGRKLGGELTQIRTAPLLLDRKWVLSAV